MIQSIEEPHTAAASLSPATQAAVQLRAWIESEAGQQAWKRAGTLLSVERIYHALDTTRAPRYGLLIAPPFFTLFSTLHPQAFTRLADRYQAAARTGLCFWWDGSILHSCDQSDVFFALLRTLPASR